MNYSRLFLKDIYDEVQNNESIKNILIDVDNIQIDKNNAYKLLQKEYKLKEAPEDGAEFFSDELLLAAILAGAIDEQGRKVVKLFDNYITDERSVAVHYKQAVREAENIMKYSFTDKTNDRVHGVLSTTIAKGSLAGVGIYNILNRNPILEHIIKGMTNSAKFYTDNYFNRIVVPRLTKAVDKILTNGINGPIKEVEHLHDILKSNLTEGTSYWRVVSNSATSRAYNYGVIKSGSVSGYSEYEFVAVMDDRTTDICQRNNKRRWKVYDACKHYETLATLSPEEMVKRYPFYNGELDNKENSFMKDDEPAYPPLHFGCRSCVRLVK
jgi:hypothetical protein